MAESSFFKSFLQNSHLSVPECPKGPFPEIPNLELRRQIPNTQVIGGASTNVSPNSENALSSAIEQAQEGSTIYVRTGIYDEPITINKSIKLVGQGKVILSVSGGQSAVTITSGNVSFTGFSIKQKKSKGRGAILMNGGSLALTNCKVSSVANSTITAKNDSSIEIKDSVIKAKGGIAVMLNQQSEIVCESTAFCKCKFASLSLRGSSICLLKQCALFENSQIGISVTDQAQASIDSCMLIDCSIESTSTGQTTIIKGTTIDKTSGSIGITLSQTTNGYLYHNSLRGCSIELRGRTVIKLNSNSYSAGSLIASDSAVVEAENESFEGESPAAIGVRESAQLTLKNARLQNLNGIGIVAYDTSKILAVSLTINGTSQQGIICHSGCDLEIQNGTIQNTNGDSILVQDANITASNLSIQNSQGNAVSITDSTSCSFTNCQILNNAQCGFIANHTAITLENINFSNNGFSAIHSIQSELKINECKFIQNTKGGIFSSSNSKLIAEKCQFEKNGWSALLTETNSKIKANSCTLTDNNIAVVNNGSVALASCTVSSHKNVAIQTFGKLKISDSSFNSNGTAIIGSSTSGKVIISKTTFTDNALNVEVTNGASLAFDDSKIVQTTGQSALNITKSAEATIRKLNLSGTKTIGIYANGKINMEESTIEQTGDVALLCSEDSTGTVKNNNFSGSEKSLCGIQVAGGNCSIISNQIKNYSQFGIYINSHGHAAVESNEIEHNKLANIWKE